ncbi:sodium/sugar symporter [Asticcacaulis sp. AND118]|uniref:sodium/sugar symporter n=1 Tax=Asticcacaulis sp. AND118 TaxID=2840468 RepID=UPI001CFF5561|nr:sodium/sugar symporter [Asticcacaulis sp. AND118]UDF03145.1 sodium/sugar symporter [Asticcacaulis sp. AND118]
MLSSYLPSTNILADIDLYILLAYIVGIFILAQVVSRRKTNEAVTSKGYFLAGNQLPWWAIGASLIAANISAEQIIGMSGSGFRIGLAIASYEWMAAITLIIVGKYFLPVFIKNGVMTMPGFLEQRFGPSVKYLMAIFWLVLYVFVNLTSILWLGATAISGVTGVEPIYAIIAIGLFALAYQINGGLKAVALTDIVQVFLLILGGLIIVFISFSKIGGEAGVMGGLNTLYTQFPEHFDMILSKDSPHYMDLPGIAVLVGGLWIMNISYWGFNQYIIQRALAAKSLGEAQKGIAFAAYLKLLMPVIVVFPGLAALILAPNIEKADHAYPAMMQLLPNGLLGLVFAALVAAIVASLASKINSISTIFTLDVVAPLKKDIPDQKLVTVGRIASVVSVIVAMAVAQPLLGKTDQAFQFIQEFTGFFTPGIVVIFALGMFWKRCSTAGAFVAVAASVILSTVAKYVLPDVPFMDRVGYVFLASLALCVLVSLIVPNRKPVSTLTLEGVSFKTSTAFNVLAIGVVIVLVALYGLLW